MWLAQYTNMSKENFMSFTDFKQELFKPKRSEKTAEEIENEFGPIIAAHEKKNNGTQ